jgi:hypothetical protein
MEPLRPKLSEKLSAAMDLKDVAAGSFEAHVHAPEVEALLEVSNSIDSEFTTEHPQPEKLHKLVDMKDSITKATHLEVAPEEALWREEMSDAIKMAENA